MPAATGAEASSMEKSSTTAVLSPPASFKSDNAAVAPGCSERAGNEMIGIGGIY